MEKSNILHSEYDEDFDNAKMRFIFRNALKADIPVHTTNDHFDKKFMVKPPIDREHLRYQKRLEKERILTKDEIWVHKNTTSTQ